MLEGTGIGYLKIQPVIFLCVQYFIRLVS